MRLTRREWLAAAGSSAALAIAGGLRQARAAAGEPIFKTIPSSGERLPPVGVGTARRYQGAAQDALAQLRETLRVFAAAGGKVIDTAPSYGNAEEVLGGLLESLALRDSLFLATKVSSTGREAGLAQIEQSFRKLRSRRIDLIAVHNLQDVDRQLATLRELKDGGRIRYVGLTTSFSAQHDELAALIRREKPDFIQVDYALDNRAAASSVLPAAQEHGAAVMVNLPFGRSSVFRAVQGRELPAWAADFDARSWAQFFLKYIISHEAVTVAIPGTATPG
ncbi:MAG: aldo/keto reductase, partial [Pollutimonas bauzanensis]